MPVECPATVVTATNGAALCQDVTGAAVAWVQVPAFTISQLDTSFAGEVFGAGFVIVGMFWALGAAIRSVFSVVRGGR